MQRQSIEELIELSGKNNLDAQLNLAWRYQNGIEVDKNIPEAIRLYQLAAQQESSIAEYNLAWIYSMELTADNDETIRLFKKAAEHGSCDAQYMLGCIYHCGMITEKNDIAAIHYFRLAADDNHEYAKLQLQALFNQNPKNAFIAYHAAITISENQSMLEELTQHEPTTLASLFYENPKDIERISSLFQSKPKIATQVQTILNERIRKNLSEFVKHVPDDTQLYTVLLNMIFEYRTQYTVPKNPYPKCLAFFKPKVEMIFEGSTSTLEAKPLSLN